MKKFLPIFLAILIFGGLSVITLNLADTTDDQVELKKGAASFSAAKAYLASMRNNRETGALNPADVLKARKEVEALKSQTSGRVDFEWVQQGPNNIGGRSRAILFDNQDPSGLTLYTGSVTGGVFKSTNLGATWENINMGMGTTLNVSCMAQADDGTIYIGTGEGFHMPGYTNLQDFGFESGFVGKGIYKLSGGNFTFMEGTEPVDETSEFAYINEIVVRAGNLWVATNTGLKFYNGSNWIDATATDGDMTGLCWDVKVSDNGFVITVIDGTVYRSNGAVDGFVSLSTGEEGLFPENGIGRVEFAIAPSDQNIVYASAASDGADFSAPPALSLYNLYLSEDGGLTWDVILPGGSSTYYILGSDYPVEYFQGDYNNSITVFPNNPDKILIGGIDLWVGEKAEGAQYYQLEQITWSGINTPFVDYFVHADHHQYVFKPGTNNVFVIATDGGIYKGELSGSGNLFSSLNKFINTTQYYKVAVTTEQELILGGTQDNGSLLLQRNQFGNMFATDIWLDANFFLPEGTDGGFCEMSDIWWYKEGVETKPPAIFMSKGPLPEEEGLGTRVRRSETFGFDFSLNFVNGDVPNGETMEHVDDDNDQIFMCPMKLWESYNDEFTTATTQFKADQDYALGDTIIVRSNNYDHPFKYVLEEALSTGDSIMVQDRISTKFFMATNNRIWMTFDALRFDLSATWFDISDSEHYGFTGNPQSLGLTNDANTLFVGTKEGRLFRISNIKYAYTYEEADVFSAECIIATQELDIAGELNQVITSISVDPLDGNKVLLTLGNYGYDNYVYYSTDALSDNPTFTSVQGNLPAMPVYSSLLEMGNDDLAILGTDMGVFASDDVASGEWYYAFGEYGDVPVFDIIQQQKRKERFEQTFYDPGTGGEFREIYPETNNLGDIYVGTYGNGVFTSTLKHINVGIDQHENLVGEFESLDVYPNPASNIAHIKLVMENADDVSLNVFDLNGRVVLSENYENMTVGENVLDLELVNISKGTYIVQLRAGNKSGNAKLIVK